MKREGIFNLDIKIREKMKAYHKGDVLVLFTENLKRKDELIQTTLAEKHKIVAQILQVPQDDFETIADVSTLW